MLRERKKVLVRLVMAAVALLSIGSARAASRPSNQGMVLLSSIGDVKSVGQTPFTGEATETVALEVPPGRQGITPTLALLYSSYTQLESLGVGWDLPIGSVERSTKEGVPSLSGTDEFNFSLGSSAGGALVPVGSGLTRPGTETSSRHSPFVGSACALLHVLGQ